LYPTVSSKLSQIWAKYIPVKDESKEGQEKEEENRLLIESIELSQYPMRQTSNGSVV
jgi:hypothetical protein